MHASDAFAHLFVAWFRFHAFVLHAMQRLARGTGLPFPFLSLGSLKGTSVLSQTEGKEGSLGKDRSPTPDRRGRIDAREKIARSWRKSSMGWEVRKRARKTCAMQAVERQTFQGSSGCNGGGEEGARLGRHARESNAMQSQEDGKVRPRRILTRVGTSNVLPAMGLPCSIPSKAHHPLGSMGWAFHRNVHRFRCMRHKPRKWTVRYVERAIFNPLRLRFGLRPTGRLHVHVDVPWSFSFLPLRFVFIARAVLVCSSVFFCTLGTGIFRTGVFLVRISTGGSTLVSCIR